MESLQSYVWRRHLLAATQRLAEAPEAHSAAVAVGFTDLVSYTARTRELAPERLDALLNDFERSVQTNVVEGGGRVIKTVGDEVMWVVSSAQDAPVRAARTALTLAGPDVRVGVAYGPTLARVGDHFGPTVNVAARLTALARPGTVLIDRGFADALEGDPRFRLRHLRAVSVRGYDHLRATVLRAA
jgi:adenylate cyclase